MKVNAGATEFNSIYAKLQETFTDLPAARSKDAKAEALRQYESEHPDKRVLIPSDDHFYGINSTGKLAPFVQWVYVPAVKDAGQEGQEARIQHSAG
jgi:putative ATP-dependent endonuclease of the OLD family